MQNFSKTNRKEEEEEEQIDLPPGFRFHPTDEELITHYLTPKVHNPSFTAIAVGEVDLNKCEPWDLPGRAKMGEKEWYFFCVRDRKYPTGLRTNRATEAGYWKATGKDREIFRGKSLVGMKKTLVFYRGRAPKGQKSNWVMHEYRLEGRDSVYNQTRASQNEWVLCRVFKKSSCGKKAEISGLVRMGIFGNELGSSLLPPLMDSSPSVGHETTSHVTCFSDSMEDQKAREDMVATFKPPLMAAAAAAAASPSSYSSYPTQIPTPQFAFSKPSFQNQALYPTQISHHLGGFQYPDHALMQDSSILRMLLENGNDNPSKLTSTRPEISQENSSARRSFEDQDDPSTSGGPVDLECLWSY